MEYKTIKEWLKTNSAINEYNALYLADLGWYDLFDVDSCIGFTKDVAAPLLEKLKGSCLLKGLKIVLTQSQHCKDDSLFESIKFLNNDERVVFNITHYNGKWEVWDFRKDTQYAYSKMWSSLVFDGGNLENVLAFFL